MSSLFTLILGTYTIIILWSILSYEAKIKDLKESISDYKRAIDYAKNRQDNSHYTYLQLENQRLRRDMEYLSQANDHLQSHNYKLKMDNQDLKAGTYGQYKGYSITGGKFEDIQYESSVYKNNLWHTNTHIDTYQDELDFEQ